MLSWTARWKDLMNLPIHLRLRFGKCGPIRAWQQMQSTERVFHHSKLLIRVHRGCPLTLCFSSAISTCFALRANLTVLCVSSRAPEAGVMVQISCIRCEVTGINRRTQSSALHVCSHVHLDI